MSLALAAVAHLGFQTTVTALVYPALAEVDDDAWRLAHERHSRRITPLVGVVYLAVLVSCALRLADPLDAATLASYAGAALALGTTAVAAAPLHGRLGGLADSRDRGPLVARLLRVDRLRWLGTVVAAAGALAALG